MGQNGGVRRRILLLLLFVGIGFVLARARRAALAPEPDADPWSPAPPELSGRRLEPTWVEPIAGECPPTHVVKGKLTSGIYHLPGGLNYERTRPDRCYADADAAESDGLRPAKR